MRELLVRGKNTIDPGGRSVEDSPVKSDFTFTFLLQIRRDRVVFFPYFKTSLYCEFFF
jgi:hypothetical protein